MNRTRALASLKLALILACAAPACAAVEAEIDGVHVEAAAVTDSIFRISVNRNADAKPLQSIYLDPARPAEIGGEVGSDNTTQVIRTRAGTLKLGATTGKYELLDASGKTVIPSSPVLATASEPSQVALHIGWPEGTSFAVYGSGNPSEQLVQKEVKARVGNGLAVQPFFWSPSGFAVFVVGTNPNAPASCSGEVKDGAITLTSRGDAADIYLMLAPALEDATRNLFVLTGRPPVPPMWAFGYLQSRWGWKDAAYIDDVIHDFDTRDIPVDAFIFDFEWYTKFPDYELPPEGIDHFSDFGFRPELLPDPNAPLKALDDARLKFIGIRKPRLGDKDTLTMIREKHWDARNRDSDGLSDQRGLDFANGDLRAWYADHTQSLLKIGVDGWWNDEGEFTYTTYSFWNLSQQQALKTLDPNQRLWTINRAFAPGLARFGAAAWNGDTGANWDALRRAGRPDELVGRGHALRQHRPGRLRGRDESGTAHPLLPGRHVLSEHASPFDR
ncbi:MAG: glycoside hydrolase family 31 protein [Tepidisphaeraceae bacterium]